MKILQITFFPQSLPADLSDIVGYHYSDLKEDTPNISPEELHQAIFKSALNKTSGSDGISHRILQLLYKDMAEYL